MSDSISTINLLCETGAISLIRYTYKAFKKLAYENIELIIKILMNTREKKIACDSPVGCYATK